MAIEHQMSMTTKFRLNKDLLNHLKDIENYSLIIYGQRLSISQIIRIAIMREHRRTEPMILEAKKIKGRYNKNGRLLSKKSTGNKSHYQCDQK